MIESEAQFLRTYRWARRFEENAESLRAREDIEPAIRHLFLSAYEEQSRDLFAECEEYDRAHHADRLGEWMDLYSGYRFWPLDPRPEDIRLQDVAHALALTNRFSGHTRVPYSVAQHCVEGSRECPPELAKAFLMHDAAEAYLGDIISPLKRLFREFYGPMEEKVMRAIAARFNFSLSAEEKQFVKHYDWVMLATEVRDLTTARVVRQRVPARPMARKLEPWTAQEAEDKFLDRFVELFGERDSYL